MACKDMTLHLPAEILSTIFLEHHQYTTGLNNAVQDLEVDKDETASEPLRSSEIILSHVCSRWRSIAADTKRLWCVVDIHMFRSRGRASSSLAVEQEMVGLYLDRSHPLSMRIEIYSTHGPTGPPRGAKFLTHLSGHAHRFESLDVHVGTEELRYMSQHFFRTAGLQSLRRLAIDVRDNPLPEIPWYRRHTLGEGKDDFTTTVPITDAGALQSVRLRGVRPDILKMQRAPLPEYVEICGGPMVDEPCLYRFLKEASATVIHLHLDSPFYGLFGFPVLGGQTTMTALRKLEVSNIDLLNHMTCPHVTELLISDTNLRYRRFQATFGLLGWPSSIFSNHGTMRKMEKLTFNVFSNPRTDWITIVKHFLGVRAYSIQHGQGEYWTGVPATFDIWTEPRAGLACFPSLQHVVVRCQNQLVESVSRALSEAFGIQATDHVDIGQSDGIV